MKKIVLSLSIVSAIFVLACNKKSSLTTYDCAGTTATYTANIATLMTENCVSCHNSNNKKGGVDVSSLGAIKQVDINKFLGSIQHVNGYAAMPEGGSKLADDKIKMISCWAQNGYAQ